MTGSKGAHEIIDVSGHEVRVSNPQKLFFQPSRAKKPPKEPANKAARKAAEKG